MARAKKKKGDIPTLYARYVGRKALMTVLSRPRCYDADDETLETLSDSVGIRAPVMIVAARFVYGHAQVLVTPHRGEGSMWVGINDKLVVLDDGEDWPMEGEPTHDKTTPPNDES